jgi:hypothetical protein
MRGLEALGIALLSTICITSISAAAGAPAMLGTSELQGLYQQRDFFTLRDRLEALSLDASSSPELRFLAAAVDQAFNDPEDSNQIIASLLTTVGLEPRLQLDVLNLQLTNHLRLHDYPAALEAARALLSSPDGESAPRAVSEAQNKLPLLEALQDVPPQRAEIRGPSRLALGQNRRVPLKIEGQKVQFALDTGANFSVIMRGEAEKLGLRIRPVGLIISTSTAKKVLGDVAVAGSVEIGKIRYQNVVFLVFPDELLTFSDGKKIPGLVGFPLVEAMEEVRFRRDNVMEIPKAPTRRTLGNLALNDLEPLTLVRYNKEDLLCRLDTGAGHTVFYEPFFQRFQERVRARGTAVTAHAGGVGGFQEIPAYRLPNMVFDLAAAGITLKWVDVYTEAIRPAEENYLFCNVGLDALGKFRAYTISFRDMALILE